MERNIAEKSHGQMTNLFSKNALISNNTEKKR